MLTYRLVHLIETHSDALASSLLRRVQQSDHTENYDKVPPEELRQRVSEIYRHLGEWLLDKGAAEIEQRYTQIGARRAQQGVPLSELIWAIILTKDNLWAFILSESDPDRLVEFCGRQELLQLIEQFFDRAIHSAAVGYEWAAEASGGKKGELKRAG